MNGCISAHRPNLVNRNALKSSLAHLHFAGEHPFNRRWVGSAAKEIPHCPQLRIIPDSEFPHDHHDCGTRTDGMKSSKTDKIEGALHEAKGKIKEVTGKIIGSPNLRNEGTVEKVSGKIQRKVGDVKKVFGK